MVSKNQLQKEMDEMKKKLHSAHMFTLMEEINDWSDGKEGARPPHIVLLEMYEFGQKVKRGEI